MGVRAAHTLDRLPTVLLADDHPAMLKRVADFLSPHFEVVAAVDNGKLALDAMARASPDVAVLDIMMPELDGIRAARELKRRDPRAKIVFLTAQEDDDYISEALSVGAGGYVVKRRMQSELVSALNLVIDGQLFISPYSFTGTTDQAQNRHLLNFYREDHAFFDQVSQLACTALTKGEHVFVLLCEAGLRSVNKQLAARLDLPESIKRMQYSCFRVGNLIGSPIPDIYPRVSLFESFLWGVLQRAAARARKRSSRLTVFSNLMAALVSSGNGRQLALRVESFWNELASRYPCLVYCGCPVTYLASKEIRESLSETCCEHSVVSAQN